MNEADSIQRMVTVRQRAAMRDLIASYGTPDKILVAYIEDDQGIDGAYILRLDWCAQKRHLFIDGKGGRITWEAFV